MDFLRALENFRTPILTKFFEIMTYGGEEITILIVACVLYWCFNKRFAYRLAFSYFLSGLTVQALKITFRVPRPWVTDPSLTPIESALETATGYSFPSGHTNSATVLFSGIGIAVKKIWVKIICFVIIVLVMLSRMYLGVHTPNDVVTSFLVTLVLVIIVNLCINHIKINEKSRLFIALLLTFIAVSVLVYSCLLHSNGTIEEKYVLDCAKSAGAGIGFAIGWYFETRFINFTEKGISLARQLFKLFIGAVVVLALKFGLKPLLGDTIFGGAFRYFLMILWAMGIYPVIIKRFFSPRQNLL